MVVKGRKVILPTLAQRQKVCTLFKQLHTLDISGLCKHEIRFLSHQTVDNEFHELCAATDFKAAGLNPTVRSYQRTFARKHGINGITEFGTGISFK